MDKDINRIVALSVAIFTVSVIVSLCVSKYMIQNEARNQEAHQTILTDTQENQEEVEVRLNDLQAQIDEANRRIDKLQQAQVETKLLEMQIEMNEVEKIEDLQTYYLTYIDVVNKYSDYIEPPTTIYEAFTEEEIMYLWRMVETETCGADFESRTHVANVAFNRMMDYKYPNTLIGVITAPGQFAYVKTNISETTKLACEYAYMFPDNTGGALAFHSGAFTRTFCGMQWIKSDNAVHHLYGRPIVLSDAQPTEAFGPTAYELEELEDPKLISNVEYIDEDEIDE